MNTIEYLFRKPLCIGLLIFIFIARCFAEQEVLVVQINDVQNRAVVGIVIRVEGASEPDKSDSHGLARIKLAANTKVNDWIHVQIVESPRGKDLVLISPWDGTVQVPPFDRENTNYVRVITANRGDRVLLENGAALVALTARINQANSPRPKPQDPEQQRREALLTISKAFGLSSEEVDKAIRAWGKRTTDPYEKGLAALYEKNYPLASKDFERSLEARGSELAKAQAATSDAAFFLGQSRYEEGKYGESASAYRTALNLRPADVKIMGNLGLSLEREGHYQEAEPLLRRALAIDEKALGLDHPTVGMRLNNLATLLLDKGDYAEAEILCRRALTIAETTLGPDHPTVAIRLGNLAASLKAKGDYVGAEPLYRRALAIDEKALGPDHPAVAEDLNNLAGLFYVKGDYAAAEALYRRALAIDEKALGADHPTTQTILFNLVVLIEIMRDKASKSQ